MEAFVHNKPHKRCTHAEHCKKALVLGMSTATQATQILGAAFFKHKYLTNPSVTPEDVVIATEAPKPTAVEGKLTC